MSATFKSLPPQQNFLGIEKEFSAFDSSRIVIVPAPTGNLASRKTSSNSGPRAVIEASHSLERFDVETKREISREQGIATIPYLVLDSKKMEASLQELHQTVLSLIGLNKFVVTLGDVCRISSALIAAFARKSESLSVLQLSALSNVREETHRTKYSDSGVMARVCEFLDPSRIVQVGIQTQSKEEAEFICDEQIKVFYAHEIHGGLYTRLLKYWDDAVAEQLTESVYITINVNALDPSLMPATDTPEPDGLERNEVTRCLKKVCRTRKILGFDLVGFKPLQTLRSPDVVAAKLVLKLLNYAL